MGKKLLAFDKVKPSQSSQPAKKQIMRGEKPSAPVKKGK